MSLPNNKKATTLPTNMKKLISSSISSLIAISAINTALAEEEVKFGIEAVTGYRSAYVHRGFEQARGTIDFQIETELAIDNQTFLNVGAWYATETGNGDFDETSVFSHLRYEQSDKLTLGLSATYRSINPSNDIPTSQILNDGIEVGAFSSWFFNENLSSTLGA